MCIRDSLKTAQIGDHHDAGDDLADDRSQCGARHAHVEGEDEQRIQNRVQNRTRQRAQHGKTRASVRADQVGSTGGENQEGKAQRGDPGVRCV